jgi:hypothetical protein
MNSKFCWYLKLKIFHAFSFDFYFEDYKFFICLVVNQKSGVGFMKKHGLYSKFVVF